MAETDRAQPGRFGPTRCGPVCIRSLKILLVRNWGYDDILLRSHHTKLNWLELVCNRCYDGCGDVYGRAPGLATPLTLTLFLTITLTRKHSSIVQFICCERVLTMYKVRRDRLRTLTDRRWPCLLLWTLSGEHGFSQSQIAEGPRDAPCVDVIWTFK